MNAKKLAVVIGLLLALSATGTGLQTFKADVVFYNDSTAAIQDVSLQEREQTTAFLDGGNFEIVLRNETRTVFNGRQRIIFQSIVDTINGSNILNLTNVSRTLYIPYDSTATRIEVRNDAGTVATASIPDELCTANDNTCSSYCQGRKMDPDCTCGNGVCDSDIEQEICPSDCRDQSNRVDQQEPPDETEPDGDGISFLQVLLYLVVVGIVGIIVYVLVQGSSSTDSQQRRGNRPPRPRRR